VKAKNRVSYLEREDEHTDSSDISSLDDDEDASLGDYEDDEDDTNILDPFSVQKEAQNLPRVNKASDYIKIESMVGDNKWNILITPSFTVKDVLEKLSKRVDSKYKFFELIQTYDEKDSQLLNPELEISTIVAHWGDKAELYKLLFNFQEYKYVQFESEMDAHKWQIKLGTDATVGTVIDKLANRIDSKYNVFELYLGLDKKRILLDRKDKIFPTMSLLSTDVAAAIKVGVGHKLKYIFRYSIKQEDINERHANSAQVPSHVSMVRPDQPCMLLIPMLYN
jgi:hypothetical protein